MIVINKNTFISVSDVQDYQDVLKQYNIAVVFILQISLFFYSNEIHFCVYLFMFWQIVFTN